MTLIESHHSACSGQKCPANAVRRIPAQPGNVVTVGGVTVGGGLGCSTSGGTVATDGSWLKEMLTKAGVHNDAPIGVNWLGAPLRAG